MEERGELWPSGDIKPSPDYDSEDYVPQAMPEENGSCVPAKAWHSFNPLNCNSFREIETGMYSSSSSGDETEVIWQHQVSRHRRP